MSRVVETNNYVSGTGEGCLTTACDPQCYNVDQNKAGFGNPYNFLVTFTSPAVLTSFRVRGQNNGQHNIAKIDVYESQGGALIGSSSLADSTGLLVATISSSSSYSSVFLVVTRAGPWQACVYSLTAIGSYSSSTSPCATPFSGSLYELRLYSRALSSAEVLTLSQPPFAALGSGSNAVLTSTPSSDTSSYTFACMANTRGNGGTLDRSSVDRSWAWSPRPFCDYCPPGTYLPSGASSCSLCPAGYFGNRAGLTSPTCSGACPIASDCPAGTAYPPSPSLSSLSCASRGARAVPTSLGMRLWPAAHPTNSQKVDLIVAPADICEEHRQESCMQRSSISMGGVTLYVVGTAADLNMEPAEDLTCSAAVS